MRDAFERFQVPAAVAVGGAIGSLGRYAISNLLPGTSFPTATFLTNVVGCFSLGVVLVLGEVVGRHRGHHHHRQPAWLRLWRPFMATGILGGFTTFSTLVLEMTMIDSMLAAVYCVSSIVLGVLAYVVGNRVAREMFAVRA